MARIDGDCTFETVAADELLAVSKSILIEKTWALETEATNPGGEPEQTPWLFGELAFQVFFAPEVGMIINFLGWQSNEPRFVLANFLDPPWLGVIQPLGEAKAHVRRVWRHEAPRADYDEILSTLMAKSPAPSASHEAAIWRELSRQMGLH